MMKLYTRKKRWKILLFASAVLIFILSLWYIDIIAGKIAEDERTRILVWADAINKKASLVNATDTFFRSISLEERKKVELWAAAYQKLISAGYTEDITFYVDIISSNTTIPVIQTDGEGRITLVKNVDFSTDTIKYLEGPLEKEFTVFPPIEVRFENKVNYLYYKESKVFTGLREVLVKQIQVFFEEIVSNAPAVPVVVTDSSRKNIITFGNIDTALLSAPSMLEATLLQMESSNKPLRIDVPGHGRCLVFYRDSYLLTQLKYFPYIQFLFIGMFLLVAYLLFSTARRSEQNQVWLGMSRETAHQLGTPLSSLIAWVELLRLKGVDEDSLFEIGKDIKRLETITERFSKIGSPPRLDPADICTVINDTVAYLRLRSSKKVHYSIQCPIVTVSVPMNVPLFEWVVENLCKNAIDAMEGSGSITIEIIEEEQHVHIDITDTGKGIPKSRHKAIFNPGYTSKKIGWGLGLSLSERIVENYHKGRIFVRSSAPGRGTTFRISLRKKI
jgi:signal transduction histidine kinase